MTSAALDQLLVWLDAKEDEHLEFKEAKSGFHFEELVKYCAAMANERGGRVILGVTDKRPRRVVGSRAFEDLERTKAGLVERLHLRIEITELYHPSGRVLVFNVPARPVGVPVSCHGAYWMRAGSSLVPMTVDHLKRILDEAAPDFTAQPCLAASISDLEPEAMEDFRRRWLAHSPSTSLATRTHEQLLADAELLVEGRPTQAALILFGRRASLGRHLARSEVVFEYRSTEAAGPAQQRAEYRQGFFSFYDALWELIDLRNDRQHYQSGLFMMDVATFNERAVREALLNAVSHRDYRHPGNTFVRQFVRRLEIVSPGGFPPGITPANVLERQHPRNRLIADTFARCGLVERAGQGLDLIFGASVRDGKLLPDFAGTDEFQVSLRLHGMVRDAKFLQFLDKVGRERVATFSTHDLLVLDIAQRGEDFPADLRSRTARLISLGLLERTGRGRCILSRRFHAYLGSSGHYTRAKGLDRRTNKALLMRHLAESGPTGSPLAELWQVLPQLSLANIRRLLNELRDEGDVLLIGRNRGGRWVARAGVPAVEK